MRTLVLLVILVLITPSCYASSLEYDLRAGQSVIQLYVEKPISGQVGAFVYSNQSKTFGQTRMGFTYSPAPWVKVAYGAGIETNGTRVGGSIWMARGKASGIYFYEKGAKAWDKLVVKYRVADRAALGYTTRARAGQGLYAEYCVSPELTVKYSGFKELEMALQITF